MSSQKVFFFFVLEFFISLMSVAAVAGRMSVQEFCWIHLKCYLLCKRLHLFKLLIFGVAGSSQQTQVQGPHVLQPDLLWPLRLAPLRAHPPGHEMRPCVHHTTFPLWQNLTHTLNNTCFILANSTDTIVAVEEDFDGMIFRIIWEHLYLGNWPLEPNLRRIHTWVCGFWVSVACSANTQLPFSCCRLSLNKHTCTDCIWCPKQL